MWGLSYKLPLELIYYLTSSSIATTRFYQNCRDGEESRKLRIFEIEFPSKFVWSLSNGITEIAKTAKFIFITWKRDLWESRKCAKNNLVSGKTAVGVVFPPERKCNSALR